MAPKKRINWDAAFADWTSLPKAERQPIEFARRLTVARQTLFERMKKEHWEERAALIDERVRRKLEAEGVRKLEDRNRDSIDIIEVFRRRYAQRLVRDSQRRRRLLVRSVSGWRLRSMRSELRRRSMSRRRSRSTLAATRSGTRWRMDSRTSRTAPRSSASGGSSALPLVTVARA
jgi:hypothetical protein